jgi:anthranilate synthase component I
MVLGADVGNVELGTRMTIYSKAVLADLLTPVSAYLRVAGQASRSFLLESVEGGERVGRYSFIGVDPDRTFRGSFREFRESFPEHRDPHPDLPPFTGGAVGSFAFEMVHEFERLPRSPGPTPPPVEVDFYSTVLAFDHVRHQIVIMSRQGRQRVEELERLLRRDGPPPLEGRGASRAAVKPLRPRFNFEPEKFESAVSRAKEYIRAGDIFQVVLSQRIEVDYEGNPFNVYRALRYINPSPYMFFLKREDAAVAGASPEMLIRVQGRELEYRPIAGTRRRGEGLLEDRLLEDELLADPKERAEHLMLVDLGRNDLGRVSQYGKVQVEDLMFVEKYSHVMHLVSSLRGRLRPELDRFDALKAAFPAGTVTGAPKVRAMEIISELEPCPRGIYSGAIGYLDESGNLDTCIAIRTMVLQEGKAIFQAGAGIVADSVPHLENQECHNKAQVLLKALEMACDI